MLNVLQAKLQQYLNCELPDVQAGFRKGRGTRSQTDNICWSIEKAREFQKNIYFCFINYANAFDCVDHNKLWKILKEIGTPDHLTCLLRNVYAGQEATVRSDMEQQTGFKSGKEYSKAVYCHPAYLTFMQSSVQFSSVQLLSCVWLFATPESQHTRLPCPSPTPGVHPNSCPSSRWCHPAILSSHPLLLPPVPPSIRVFSSESALCMSCPNFSIISSKTTQDWSPLGWTGWISLQSERLLRVFPNTTVQKHQFFCTQLSL